MASSLKISPQIKDQIKTLVAWAERPENWYRPSPEAKVPGDDPAYVIEIPSGAFDHEGKTVPGHQCVYTHTVLKDAHFRHLSVSLYGRSVHPVVIWTLAAFFGFTGGEVTDEITLHPAPDWLLHVDQRTRAVVVVQGQTPP